MFRKKQKRPSLLEIENILRTQLAPEFADLERLRKKVYFSFSILLVVIPVDILILSRPTILQTVGGLLGFLLYAPLLIAPLVAYGGQRARKEFSSTFKDRVMKPVAKRFFPDLVYNPQAVVPKSFYDESDLFRKDLDIYTGNDFFSGRIGEVDFQFSELLCQYQTGSGKSRQTHTAFRGFFFVGDFHRDFYFRTKICPDQAEKWLGVLGRGLQRVVSGSKLVDLEDPEFEQMFVVTGDDQVEARFILTPVFMEKLKDFRKRVGNDVFLSFVNGKMMLAIETRHDYFEPNLWGDILRRQDLMKFIDMLSLLTGVAEEFLHHPKFAANPPKMPHTAPFPKATPPPLTPMQKLWVKGQR